jgi:hypothetical protein
MISLTTLDFVFLCNLAIVSKRVGECLAVPLFGSVLAENPWLIRYADIRVCEEDPTKHPPLNEFQNPKF